MAHCIRLGILIFEKSDVWHLWKWLGKLYKNTLKFLNFSWKSSFCQKFQVNDMNLMVHIIVYLNWSNYWKKNEKYDLKTSHSKHYSQFVSNLSNSYWRLSIQGLIWTFDPVSQFFFKDYHLDQFIRDALSWPKWATCRSTSHVEDEESKLCSDSTTNPFSCSFNLDWSNWLTKRYYGLEMICWIGRSLADRKRKGFEIISWIKSENSRRCMILFSISNNNNW